MKVLNRLYKRVRGDLDWGCFVVGGKEEMGPDTLFLRITEEACAQNRTLIIIDGKQDRMERQNLISHVVSLMHPGTKGYVFSPDVSSSDPFDPLSAYADHLDRAGLIGDLLVLHGMDPKYRSDTVAYFQLVMETTGKALLKEILSIDPRTLDTMLSSSDWSAKTFTETYRTKTYGSVISAIRILLHSHEGAIMSGSLKMKKVLGTGNVVILSDKPPVSGAPTDNGLVKSVLPSLIAGMTNHGLTNAVILLRHADFIPQKDLEALMDIAMTNYALFVWMPENVAVFSKLGSPVLEKVEFLSVFQSDHTTAEAWSAMFGHQERVKSSVTNTSPKSFFDVFRLSTYLTGGMSVRPSSWRGSRAVTHTKEDRPNVEAHQISTLRPGRAWCRYPDGGFSLGHL